MVQFGSTHTHICKETDDLYSMQKHYFLMLNGWMRIQMVKTISVDTYQISTQLNTRGRLDRCVSYALPLP